MDERAPSAETRAAVWTTLPGPAQRLLEAVGVDDQTLMARALHVEEVGSEHDSPHRIDFPAHLIALVTQHPLPVLTRSASELFAEAALAQPTRAARALALDHLTNGEGLGREAWRRRFLVAVEEASHQAVAA